jgi:hypothetical protein
MKQGDEGVFSHAGVKDAFFIPTQKKEDLLWAIYLDQIQMTQHAPQIARGMLLR